MNDIRDREREQHVPEYEIVHGQASLKVAIIRISIRPYIFGQNDHRNPVNRPK